MTPEQKVREQIDEQLKQSFAEKGGLARMYQLFGNQMDAVMEELNETLVA